MVGAAFTVALTVILGAAAYLSTIPTVCLPVTQTDIVCLERVIPKGE